MKEAARAPFHSTSPRGELVAFDAALSRRGLAGVVKRINERHCILPSPTSLGMHVCMLNIWICIAIEHLLSELAVSQRCALNNNPAEKSTAYFLPLACNWMETFCFPVSSKNWFWLSFLCYDWVKISFYTRKCLLIWHTIFNVAGLDHFSVVRCNASASKLK